MDTVVQRGGFKGEELSTIGQLRDQAVQIVQMVEQLSQKKDLLGDLRITFCLVDVILLWRLV